MSHEQSHSDPLFPFGEKIPVENKQFASIQEIEEHIWPLLTHERQQRIEQVCEGRLKSIAVVMEDIYDRGNVSAVLRSAEAFGVFQFHQILLRDKMKTANRVSKGAEKWVESRNWANSTECVKELKRQGRKVYATSLSADAIELSSIDWTKASAIVLGNEKDGISEEMKNSCDAIVQIPMYGFVQSFNISVAAALCIQTITTKIREDRKRKSSENFACDLDVREKAFLRALYAVRTLDSSSSILSKLA